MASYHPLHSPLDAFNDQLLISGGFEPRFGLGLSPSDFRSDHIVPRAGGHHLPTGYRRPWAVANPARFEVDQKHRHIGKEGFQASIDVHHFRPSELSVKTVDNTVIIEGRHEDRDDNHGSVQRHFVRKYFLPDNYDMSSIHSTLSSDGVLTIKAPPPSVDAKRELHITIEHTNMPVQLSVKPNTKEIVPSSVAQISSEVNGRESSSSSASKSASKKGHKSSK